MMASSGMKAALCGTVVKFLVAVAILNKIFGKWGWKISWLILPIAGIVGRNKGM